MIVTLTPNPSLDLLFAAERLVWDDANRVPTPRRRPGGQGINVVRAVRSLRPDLPAVAVAPLGGPVGRELREILDAEGTPLRVVPVDAETRIFVGARESETGRSLLLNPRGPAAPAGLADALADAVAHAVADAVESLRSGDPPPGPPEAATPAVWVAACGSLLPGLPDDFYARIGRIADRFGARFVPDCDGPALAAAAPHAHLLVPNDMEAERLVGRPVRTPEEAADAGRILVGRGADRVVITLGDRGAVEVTADGAWRASPRLPPGLARAAERGSAVGAGDAFLAALLMATGSPESALRAAVATGTAVLLGRGTELVSAGSVEEVLPHVDVERVGS